MRYRVELDYGYVSYDESDAQKAVDLFNERGVRLFRCRDIFDEGTLVFGPPVVVDIEFELRRHTAN